MLCPLTEPYNARKITPFLIERTRRYQLPALVNMVYFIEIPAYPAGVLGIESTGNLVLITNLSA